MIKRIISICVLTIISLSCTAELPLELENPNDPRSDLYIPAEPTEFEYQNSENEHVQLSWSDNSLGEDFFVIEGRESESSDDYRELLKLNADVTTCLLTGLDTNKVYELRVRSVHEESISDFSNPVMMQYGYYIDNEIESEIYQTHSSDFGFIGNQNILFVIDYGTIRVFEMNTLKYDLSYWSYISGGLGYKFSINGKYLVIYGLGLNSKGVYVFEVENGTLIYGSERKVSNAKFTNSNTLLFLRHGASVSITDIVSGNEIWEMDVEFADFNDVYFTGDGEMYFLGNYNSATPDRTIQVYSTNDYKFKKTIELKIDRDVRDHYRILKIENDIFYLTIGRKFLVVDSSIQGSDNILAYVNCSHITFNQKQNKFFIVDDQFYEENSKFWVYDVNTNSISGNDIYNTNNIVLFDNRGLSINEDGTIFAIISGYRNSSRITFHKLHKGWNPYIYE